MPHLPSISTNHIFQIPDMVQLLTINFVCVMYLQGSHGEVSHESCSEMEESEDEGVTTVPSRSYAGLDEYGDQSNVSNDGNCDSDESLDVFARKYLCKIRGQNRLTGKAVQNIAVATDHFIQQMLANVKRNVGDILQNAGIGNEEDLENIERVFDDAAQKVELLRTPLSETFSNRSNYCGLDKIVSNITFPGSRFPYYTNFDILHFH